MFRLFTKKLTEYSHEYVDWSRIGELLKSGNHHYSKKELETRGLIIACTAIFAFLGAHLNNNKKTSCSNLTVAIASGSLAFTLSHALVILPLIKKRHQMNKEFEQSITAIQAKLDAVGDLYPEQRQEIHTALQKVIDAIRKLSLADEKNDKASLTWGKRKRLMARVSEKLNSGDFDLTFWQQDLKVIYAQLEEPIMEETQRYSGPR